ncbi:MAG TPA: DegT/DnrJ/EryC1/StrS aminotransferase family protein [Thermomicrobiales bacterium]|nr:DegT/DnrJ/EryC1/StrS aminotransferase family protein [Thermomicrobiales bacterium]
MREDFLVFGKPQIGEEEIAEVVATLRSGWIGMGPRTLEFERAFAEYVGAKHAIAVNSCTAALHLALIAAGVGPGDEVITTPMTFAATANVIVHTGATPVFADVDRRTQNIDPARVAERITPRTKAILPVHMLGRPAEMDPLLALAAAHDLAVIEDAAHAAEAIYRGRRVGTLGHFTAFSFYATKNITTGEGGMLVTGDDAAAERLRVLRLHGISKDAWKRYSAEGFSPYETIEPGFKYNMLDLTAALGLHQLRRVEENLTIRERYVALYNEAFAELPGVIVPALEPLGPGDRHAQHLYPLLLDLDRLALDRAGFIDALQERRIGTGIHFTAVHLHQYYRERFGYRRGDFPEAEYISDRTVSLPLSPAMTERDVEDVIAAVGDVVAAHRR